MDISAKRAKRNEYMKGYYARNKERVKADVSARSARDRADPVRAEKLKELDRERQRRYRERQGDRYREMTAARVRKHYAADPVKARHAQYRYFYNITAEDYAAMLKSQGGVCAICALPPKAGKLLNVDHDHDTNAVRGLLCRDCNLAIGHFKDDKIRMQKAISYIEAPPGIPQTTASEAA